MILLIAGVAVLSWAAAVSALIKLHQIGRGLHTVEARLGAIEQRFHKF